MFCLVISVYLTDKLILVLLKEKLSAVGLSQA